MKKSLIILSLFIFGFGIIPTFAQDSGNIITLDDTTPAIDAVISLPPDTTGTIALNLALASVQLTDSAGNVILSVADPRLHALEINIMPNTGAHTLTVSRLPNVSVALVSIIAIPELTVFGTTSVIDAPAIGLNQEAIFNLDSSAPGHSEIVTIPENTQGLIGANFMGISATTQWVDSEGVVVLETVGGHVDGINAVLDAGEYTVTVLGTNLTQSVPIGIRAIEAREGGFVVMTPPENLVNATLEPATAMCSATVTTSSVNLRSGPGTGYSVLGYGYFNETYPVGGQNPENNWVVVGTSGGESAWVSRDLIQLIGTCTDLTVFNIPLQNAPASQVIITTTGTTNPPPYNDDDDHEEHDDDDHEEHDDEEHEDD